jgi:hypothetical protein
LAARCFSGNIPLSAGIFREWRGKGELTQSGVQFGDRGVGESRGRLAARPCPKQRTGHADKEKEPNDHAAHHDNVD